MDRSRKRISAISAILQRECWKPDITRIAYEARVGKKMVKNLLGELEMQGRLRITIEVLSETQVIEAKRGGAP